MKIAIVSHSDQYGGAAIAAHRLNSCLLALGKHSNMLVQSKLSDDYSVSGPTTVKDRLVSLLHILLGKKTVKLQKSDNPTFHTSSYYPFRERSFLKQVQKYDVINLHWFRETPSIPTLGCLQKPVVWTLHDMWAFCGAEHYTEDTVSSRWRAGYTKKNRPQGHRGLDIDRYTWQHKKKYWKTPFHIITPSRWLAECVTASRLMQNWPVHVIPNPLDMNVFKSLPDKQYARHVLNLPKDKKIILFGAFKGETDKRKGFDLLQDALLRLASTEMQTVECVVFGQNKPQEPVDLGIPIHWMGHLHDDPTLALLYNAADVMVVPSRQENLPQTGTEAQACGCPVVAFNATGLPDVVEHKKTGYLARPFDPEDLAHGIRWVLNDRDRYNNLAFRSHQRARKLWDPEVVIPLYLSVYRQAVEKNRGRL